MSVNQVTESDVLTEEFLDHIDDLPWSVYIYNDPVNLINYVIGVLKEVFGFSNQLAYKLTLEAHNNGKALLWSGGKEEAENYVKKLVDYKLTADLIKN